MRASKSRSRNKSNRNRPMGNVVNRVFDSSGPDSKVRGTPQQIIDKYNQLARDAQVSGDRVATENYQQHAEHYLRLLNSAQREQDQRREEQERQNRERQAERDRERSERQGRESNAEAGGGSGGGGSGGGSSTRGGGQAAGTGPQPDMPQPVGEGAPDSALVDTPENREAAAPRRPRKPRSPQKDKSDSEAPDDGVAQGGNGTGTRAAE